jgi:arginine exporter protein ArgO
MAEIDANMQTGTDDDMGMYAIHPVRTAGAAFLIGLGAGMMATKMRSENKSSIQQIMDRLGI